jgi:hypothetical protein
LYGEFGINHAGGCCTVQLLPPKINLRVDWELTTQVRNLF